jgi:hypothetical protein
MTRRNGSANRSNQCPQFLLPTFMPFVGFVIALSPSRLADFVLGAFVVPVPSFVARQPLLTRPADPLVRSLLGWCSALFEHLVHRASTRADSVHTVHKMHNGICVFGGTTPWTAASLVRSAAVPKSRRICITGPASLRPRCKKAAHLHCSARPPVGSYIPRPGTAHLARLTRLE